MITKILLIGCGDVSSRLAAMLPPERFECTGLRRRIDLLPPYIRGIRWDLNQNEGLAEKIRGFDVVVITPVPNSRDEAGYQRAYCDNLRKVVAALEAGPPPKLVILVSSTSVYGQNRGEWVDESSPTEPPNFRGQGILAGENLLRASSLEHCVLRFSGIYGPGRDRLIQQVLNGETSPQDADFSNRIHSEDCAGVLAHIVRKHLRREQLNQLYLASDNEPVRLAEVKQWFAERLAVDNAFLAPAQPAGGKRCCNERLLASGYEFRYPTFRAGYEDMLRAEKAERR